ncbi:hypothetical protein AAF712_015990, partial [Marasmius tenuissimus]
MAAASQALITYCLWYSFKAHMDEASTNPQRIFQRLSLIVVLRGAILTLTQLVLAILYLAQPHRLWWTPIHQVLATLYYSTAIATLNMREISRFKPQELEIVKESLRDSVLERGLSVTAPVTDDPLMNYINHVHHPAPVLNIHPTETTRPETSFGTPVNLRLDQGNREKGFPVEPWRPTHHGLGLLLPVSEDTNVIHALEPNRFQEDVSVSSTASK